jgi:hypothetical protein
MLTVPRSIPDGELPGTVVDRADSDRHSSVLVATDLGQLAAAQRPGWQAGPVGFEQLVLAYLRRPPVGGNAIFAVAVGSLMRSAFDADGLGACLARSGGSGCPAVITSFVHRFNGPAAITANLPLLVFGDELVPPASRFWTLQLIEGGIFLVIAAAALGTAVWLLHRRTT